MTWPADDGDEFDALLDAGLQRGFESPEGDPGASAKATEDSEIRTWIKLPDADTAIPSDLSGVTDDIIHALEAGDRYRILGELGRGGMGIVLSAVDLRLGRQVAIKILQETPAADSRALRSFIEEAQIAGQLQHPSIVPVYDIGFAGPGRIYFSMKFVRGQTLKEALGDRGDSEENLTSFLGHFSRAVEAVSYAHARGVVHRDLKPSNIMLGRFGEVLVLDWGLAKLTDTVSDRSLGQSGSIRILGEMTEGLHSVAGQVKGTPSYMSPEQARGETDSIGPRSDVFALGGILAEIITGKGIHDSSDVAEIHARTASGNFDQVHARLAASKADDAILRLARDCLSVDASNRPRDAGVVAQRLMRHRDSLESRARDAELLAIRQQTRADEERRVRLRTLVLSSITLALVIGAVITWIWLDRQTTRQTRDNDARIWDDMRTALLLRERASADADAGRRAGFMTDALKYAERARATADAGQSSPKSVREADQLVDEITETLRTMRAEQMLIDRDASTVRRLDRVREMRAVDHLHGEVDRELIATFEGYGILVSQDPLEFSAKPLKTSRIQDRLIAGLHEWIVLRRFSNPRPAAAWRVLENFVAQADPNRDRAEIMRGILSKDPAANIPSNDELDRLPAATLELIGYVLASVVAPDSAVVVYARARDRFPDDYWINYGHAVWLTWLTPPRLEEASRIFTAAVALNPRSPLAYTHLGVVLKRLGRGSDARAMLRRGIELNPRIWHSNFHFGRHLLDVGEFEEALPHLSLARSLAPGRGFNHTFEAVCLQKLKRFEEARVAHDAAVARSPDSSSIHNRRGAFLLGRGQGLKAERDFERAIAIDEDNHLAHYNLGAARLERKDFAGAAAAFKRSTEIESGFIQARFHRGSTLIRMERFDEAIESMKRLLEIDPDHRQTRANLGQILRQQGLAREALPHLLRSLDDNQGRTGLVSSLERSIEFCRNLIDEEDHLMAVLASRSPLPGNSEIARLAGVARRIDRPLFELRLWRSVLSARATAAGETGRDWFFRAAIAAVGVALGEVEGEKSVHPDLVNRAWGEALDWLGRQLDLFEKAQDSGTMSDRALSRILDKWELEPRLLLARSDEAEARFSTEDREKWEAFWDRFEDLQDEIAP